MDQLVWYGPSKSWCLNACGMPAVSGKHPPYDSELVKPCKASTFLHAPRHPSRGRLLLCRIHPVQLVQSCASSSEMSYTGRRHAPWTEEAVDAACLRPGQESFAATQCVYTVKGSGRHRGSFKTVQPRSKWYETLVSVPVHGELLLSSASWT